MTSSALFGAALFLGGMLGGCDQSPPAGEGVCCPIAASHSCGSPPVPAGGWASSMSDCEWHMTAFDVAYTRGVDGEGCAVFIEDRGICCGCVPDTGVPDSGPPDAGPMDAGPMDAGPPDAGPPDSGPPDTGPPDTGPPDAGPPDTGPPRTPTGTPGCREDMECAEGICWDMNDYDPLCFGTVCSLLCLDDITCQNAAAAAGASNPSRATCGSDNRCNFLGTGLFFIACA